MFTWSYEDSMEVDLSLRFAWDFFTDPGNWPRWEDRIEYCTPVGEVKTGSRVVAKVKNKAVTITMWVTEVKPYRECKILVKAPFFTQEALATFQEISPGRTRITLKRCIIGIFVPFMKAFFLKNTEKTYSLRKRAFAEIAEKV
jgi:hypothetical protein